MLRLSSMPSKRGLRRFFQGLFKKYKTAEAGDIIESEILTQSENFDILVRTPRASVSADELTEWTAWCHKHTLL